MVVGAVVKSGDRSGADSPAISDAAGLGFVSSRKKSSRLVASSSSAAAITIARMPPADADTAATAAPRTGPARALQSLGLTTPLALALHLPLRYEDETRLTSLAEADPGEPVQVEVTVRDARVELRPRRQLIVRTHDDDGEPLVLRFVHFYPSHQKALQPGVRVRVRGDLRGGFFGREMIHPQFKAVSRLVQERMKQLRG